MKAQKSGHIINVSSVAGHTVRPGGAVYSATKHAVRVISEGLRQEVKPYNIRSTIISPGAVATELPDSITEPDVAKGIHDFYAQLRAPAELVCAHGRVRDQPAGRRRRQRNPVPARRGRSCEMLTHASLVKSNRRLHASDTLCGADRCPAFDRHRWRLEARMAHEATKPDAAGHPGAGQLCRRRHNDHKVPAHSIPTSPLRRRARRSTATTLTRSTRSR